jgi:hypothetical protein
MQPLPSFYEKYDAGTGPLYGLNVTDDSASLVDDAMAKVSPGFRVCLLACAGLCWWQLWCQWSSTLRAGVWWCVVHSRGFVWLRCPTCLSRLPEVPRQIQVFILAPGCSIDSRD